MVDHLIPMFIHLYFLTILIQGIFYALIIKAMGYISATATRAPDDAKDNDYQYDI